MQVILDGDISFVQGWQKDVDYDSALPAKRSRLTRVPFPPGQDPSKEFYDAQYPAIDAKITTPVAFAIVAPKGWAGEKTWYAHQAFMDHGWENIGWKESSHNDHTWVQMYMRTLDRPLPKEPKFVDADSLHSYVGLTHKGTIAYLGCSSILSSFAKPKDKFEIPKPVGCYGGVSPEKFMHFIRQVRPGSLYSMALLKKEGFRKVYSSPFAHYWLRSKIGVGSAELCEY